MFVWFDTIEAVRAFAKTFLKILYPALLFVMVFSGCASMTSPPAADVAAGGVYEQTSFEFLRWQEGLAIMIWYDFAGESGTFSTSEKTSFTAAPYFKLQGYAESQDGDRFDWEVQTSDGQTAQFWLDGKPYNLSDGGLFLVRMKDGEAEVTQLDRDLSGVQSTYDSCLAFAKNDPDLARFIATGTATRVAPPTSAPGQTTTSQTPLPTSSPTPLPPTPTVTPLPPTFTPIPAPAIERIRFAPGATQATVEGYLPVDGRALYVMHVQAGQFVEMNAAVGATGQGLRFSIVGADGTVVRAMGEAHVRTIVPSTQDYYVELVSDVGATNYHLSVLIPVRIRFAVGATSAEVAGSLAADHMRHYVLHARTGQRLIITPHTTRGHVRLTISGIDGQVLLSGHVGPPDGGYDGILPVTQDYLISVRAEGGAGADYALEIVIPAEKAESRIAIVGTVMDVSLSARIITLREPADGFSVISLTEESELFSVEGGEITLRDIRPGTSIQALGQPGESNALLASEVRLLKATPTVLPTDPR